MPLGFRVPLGTLAFWRIEVLKSIFISLSPLGLGVHLSSLTLLRLSLQTLRLASLAIAFAFPRQWPIRYR